MSEVGKPQYFLKGKSRHLFWPFLAFLVVDALLNQFSNPIQALIHNYTAPGFAVTIAYTVIVGLALAVVWVAYLLACGLGNGVKAFKVVFIVLACAQLLQFPASVINGFWMRSILPLNIVTLLSGLMQCAVYAAWIAGLLFVAFNANSKGLLRVAAGALAAVDLYLLVYVFVSMILAAVHIAPMRGWSYIMLTVINELLALGGMAFFFGAMSFSKMNSPNPVAAPSGSMPA